MVSRLKLSASPSAHAIASTASRQANCSLSAAACASACAAALGGLNGFAALFDRLIKALFLRAQQLLQLATSAARIAASAGCKYASENALTTVKNCCTGAASSAGIASLPSAA